MQSTITEEIKVTPSEVKRFFKNIPKDSLPYFSTEVEIAQIVKKPEVSVEERDRIEKLLIQIRQEALDGTDFQVLAGTALSGSVKTYREAISEMWSVGKWCRSLKLQRSSLKMEKYPCL
jgi:hypothetical protein